MFNAIDTYLNINTFTRTIGNISKTIDVNTKSIIESDIKLDLKNIKVNKFNNKTFDTSDPFIGTLDLETYYDKDYSKSKVYALGFYTRQYGCKTFYIDKTTLDSEELILRCLVVMISHKYNGYTFMRRSIVTYEKGFKLYTSPLHKLRKLIILTYI